jgi:hypothetical protein
MPEVTHPRATSGDAVVEPDWDDKLTITVGPGKAVLTGDSDKVIQAAADYAARLGGGTVRILPGTYRMRNSIFTPSGVRITGSGPDTVLMKEPAVETILEANSDWYDQEVTLKDASGFEVGDGICLITKNPHTNGTDVLKRTLIARSGNRFKLDEPLRKNFWTDQTPRAMSVFPLITAEYKANIAVENLALDGNKDNNPHLDGNHSGCAWFQDCSRLVFRKVEARNQNGDGISFQICHDVVVEECHSHDNIGLGLHPGSGSQRPVMRGNLVERNRIGIFFCWGVTYGLADKNRIRENAEAGVSIGHNDNGNAVRDNDISGNGQQGILFRECRKGFAPKRNTIEANRVIDNGPEDGVAIDVQGLAADNVLKGNTLRETRGTASRTGIRIGADTRGTQLLDNTIEGFATPIDNLTEG